MANRVEIISKETILPSSPAEPHIRELKLSFLDQIAVPIYTPIIYFYTDDQSDQFCPTDILLRLKKSLSDALTIFYPIAGRIRDGNRFIDCNDNGAEFIEAMVHRKLADIIENCDMDELREYLPVQPQDHPHQGEATVLLVQANLFDCGGIAMAVCLSHKVADGNSLSKFVQAWAAISRGEAAGVVAPNFHVLAEQFRPIDLPEPDLSPSKFIYREKIVTRRFIYDDQKLASLRAEIATAEGSKVKDPSRVEAVSASIWRHFIEHHRRNGCRTFAAVHPVNLRPRMADPPLQAFGNCYVLSPAYVADGDGEHELHRLAELLRNAFRKIDGEYIGEIQRSGGGEYQTLRQSIAITKKEGASVCSFSSWCGFPVYGTDFGWGKPAWVCTTIFPFKNIVILMSRADGKGIEAWVNMLEDDDDGDFKTLGD
ncbi:stemmadenine O-acetyltransferase-like [Andrographis paniculata]|uniref:stemmadenine O-acetyltransferase-like n=1 Tax=Andrographis paniculata TaxID=175694 RepID=UPI0021E9783A|nr:stemmadenine O-acetyltransferase-like [Andrographis paniculata]